MIADAGYGEQFIHRTGHGIGLFEHEDPYIVEGNAVPLEAGHAFSIEPGIYVEGRWGARLEDIVVATDDGPLAAEHGRSLPRRRGGLSRAPIPACPSATPALRCCLAVGHRRPAVPLGDDPPPRGRPRLRLARCAASSA